jgi:hypothetical protein
MAPYDPEADLDRWTWPADCWMLTRTLPVEAVLSGHDRFAGEVTE